MRTKRELTRPKGDARGWRDRERVTPGLGAEGLPSGPSRDPSMSSELWKISSTARPRPGSCLPSAWAAAPCLLSQPKDGNPDRWAVAAGGLPP